MTGPATVIPEDGTTATVRVPIALRRRGGRKVVLASDGNAMSAPGPHVHGPLVKALGRAFRWRKLIETGVHGTIAELAAAEKINPSFVSRVLRLTLLAPEIVEEIVDGRQSPETQLGGLLVPLPPEWDQQNVVVRRMN
ncbi:MAG: hypothetical protein AB7G07_09065 [Bauldia sp.]